jgi:hypothetical protein
MSDDEAVRLAREWLALTDPSDALIAADALARAVLALHAENERLMGAGYAAMNPATVADIINDRDRLRSENERLRGERDAALADGVLSQRVCDIENDRAQLLADRDRLRAGLAEALRIAGAANNDPGALEDHDARNKRIDELWKEHGL